MAWHRRTLTLSGQERKCLEDVRDHDVKPHMRQKATALLLIAEGHAPPAVAQGLLGKALDEDTVYRWLNVYEGCRDINQLQVKAGRGRHPAFFPSDNDSRLCGVA